MFSPFGLEVKNHPTELNNLIFWLKKSCTNGLCRHQIAVFFPFLVHFLIVLNDQFPCFSIQLLAFSYAV